ncbi:MAG: hypothetical protein IJS17_02155, partial [Clostridia bacterium]|nr:hypothetical protein [Clostridia bacterium]
YDVYECSRCDATENRNEVAALGHDIVEDAAVAPTCTETGLTAGSHCTRCDDATVAQEVVPALGHDIVEDAAVAPTCTETGLTAGSHCTRCDDATVAQEVVEALGHDYVAAVTAPTCTEGGYTTYSCSRCDASYVADETAALGHDWDEGRFVAATCTDDGYMLYSCSRCDATYTEKVEDALGHEPGERQIETVNGVEKYVTRCDACGEIVLVEDIDYADYTEVDAAIAAANAVTVVEYYNYSDVTAAINAVERGLNAEHQADVDAMAAAINDAVAALKTVDQYLRFKNATASISGTTITFTPNDGEIVIYVYASLTDTTPITFTDLTGSTILSKSGYVYAKNNGTAKTTINGTVYTLVFQMEDEQEVAFEDNIRYAFATVSVEGSVITFTPVEDATQISFYPSLWDGTPVVFSNLEGETGISKNGTLYATGYGTAIATIDGTHYTVVFDMVVHAEPTLEELLRYSNATVAVDGTTITLTPTENAKMICLYPALWDLTPVTFVSYSDNVVLAKDGYLYAKNYGTANVTIDGTSYQVIFDMPQVPQATLAEQLRYANATVAVDGTTITLTPVNVDAQVNLYPTLYDGTAITFSELSENAGVSRNNTLYAKDNATATATINGVEYTVVFDFSAKPVVETTVLDKIKVANATASLSGTTITLTPVENATQINLYPTLVDGSALSITNLSENVGTSKNGTAYAKNYGTATITVDGVDYTVVFDLPAKQVAIGDLIRTANATVSVEGTTITLTAVNTSKQVCLYPTTTGGEAITISDMGTAKVSKAGTCYSKVNATCTMTYGGVDYTVLFVF